MTARHQRLLALQRLRRQATLGQLQKQLQQLAAARTNRRSLEEERSADEDRRLVTCTRLGTSGEAWYEQLRLSRLKQIEQRLHQLEDRITTARQQEHQARQLADEQRHRAELELARQRALERLLVRRARLRQKQVLAAAREELAAHFRLSPVPAGVEPVRNPYQRP